MLCRGRAVLGFFVIRKLPRESFAILGNPIPSTCPSSLWAHKYSTLPSTRHIRLSTLPLSLGTLRPSNTTNKPSVNPLLIYDHRNVLAEVLQAASMAVGYGLLGRKRPCCMLNSGS